MQIQTEHPSVKVVFVGDANVGKTCIISRYVNGTFTTDSPTVGAAYFTKEIEIDNEKYDLNIWDTAGQECYRYLVPMYYRSASVAILVYDITVKSSFDSLDFWMKDIKKVLGGDISFILCGNKYDLEEERVVSEADVQRLAENMGVQFVETSAVSGYGISKLFDSIQKLIEGNNIKKKNIEEDRQNKPKKLDEENEEKNCSC